MLSDTDRADARTATTVRDSKGLVQVQVADVSSHIAWVGPADLSIEIGAVHVDLSADLVDAVNDLTDVALEDTVRTWVGDHDGCDTILVLLGELHKVIHINVAIVGRADGDRVKACLYSTGGVGTVCRSGKDDEVTSALTRSLQITMYDPQTSVLTSSTRVGLERSTLHTSNLAEESRQVAYHL